MPAIRSALVNVCLILATCLVVWVGAGSLPHVDHGVDLPTNRPLIIAHQGSSGELPEQSLGAYELAVEQGADVLECDVGVSKDLKLVCIHESWMSRETNVKDVFPDERMNTYYVIDNKINVTDYFTVDFNLSELKTIKKIQSHDFRDQSHNDRHSITTLHELIGVAKSANRKMGLYLETKQPQWVNSLDTLKNANTTLEDLLLEELRGHGYTGSTDPCFLQSFIKASLQYLKQRTALPLVMLLGSTDDVSDSALQEYATFAYGIGPAKRLIVQTNSEDQITGRSNLVERAHDLGMRVHPWTFRHEDRYLAWDYGQDYVDEYEDFLQLRVDGFFTDFPKGCARFLDVKYSETSVASTIAPQITNMAAISVLVTISFATVTS